MDICKLNNSRLQRKRRQEAKGRSRRVVGDVWSRGGFIFAFPSLEFVEWFEFQVTWCRVGVCVLNLLCVLEFYGMTMLRVSSFSYSVC